MKSLLHLVGPVVVAALSSGLVSLTAQSSDQPPPRYALGTVPDLTVWSGSTRLLLIHAGDPAGAVLTLQAAPPPQGPLSLELYQEPDWLFRYSPAPQDKTPFTVTVTATKNGQTTAQSWQVTPEPVLPPETDFFGTEKHTQPVPISTSGIEVFDQAEPLKASLNYQSQFLHHARIVGDTVVLQANHANGLYEAYCNGDRDDLKSLEIIAERVVVRSPVRLKQTQVTIWARQLAFEGEGQIKTTPEEKPESPGSNGTGGLAGADGLPAGNVTLNIGEWVTDSPGIKFDLTGGQGQPGGPGQHGANGSSISTYWSSARVCDTGICKTYTPSKGHYITYYRYTFAGATVSEKGTKSWPQNGTDAQPSGKPGEGGAAGSLTSSADVSGFYALPGGLTPGPTLPTRWPYDHYAGGAAGTPTVSEHVTFYVEWFQMKSTVDATHTTKAGQDAAVGKATTLAGGDGTYTFSDSPTAWIHPLAVRKVLEQIRDDYLGNHIADAQARLEDYIQLLSDYRASPLWASLDPSAQLDLAQMQDEMTVLLQRLQAGLDYFGNPAGWVPMLSFEVNTTLFSNEIDRAINMLYLVYWIKHKAQTEQQRVDALATVRDQLRAELQRARSDYDDAVKRLPLLRTKANQLNSDIGTVQLQLETKETELRNDTREPSWVFGLRFGLKLSAAMCQMIPVYQPALGTVGEGLRVASDFDPNRPWDSIQGAGNVASAYLDSDFEASAEEQQTAKDGVDPAQVEEKGFDYAGALQTAATGLAAGVQDIQGFLKDRQAPSAEMLAQLERLKSRSPEYKALVEEVEALMERNREFTEELVATMQDITRLSDVMTRDVLAIGALSRQIAPAAVVLDERATAYLDDMERHAYDRLLKYHYYMAKAYEYRLLKPYTQPLSLEGLTKKFEEIADLNSDSQITPDQFDSLKGVYQQLLSDVAETIFDQYNSHAPDLSVPVRFSLTEDQIAALNADQTITLNLHDAGIFPPDDENIRIVELNIDSITTEPVNGSYGNTAYVDVHIAHSGISNLKMNGAIYRFRHYNRLTSNPIVWGGRYDPVDNRIDPIQPSEAQNSLLRSLLTGPATADMLLYSRPAAWADLNVSRSYFDSSGGAIHIKSIRLEMRYDFTPRDPSLGQRDVEVLVTAADPASSNPASAVPWQPYFQVSLADVNGRQDARGRFVRVFRSSPEPVTVSAPMEYGQWRFDRWTDSFGRDLPGGPFTDPELSLNLQSDLTLAAQYVPKPSEDLLLAAPVRQGNTLMLQWNGGPGIRLQTAPALGGAAWQNVPGSDGQSQFAVPLTGKGAYFRVAH